MRSETCRPAGAWLLAFVVASGGLSPGARCAEPPAASGPDLVLVSAGTRVGERAPNGWSDVVLKSVSRLESGDLDSLPSIASATATLFRTVLLADVRPVLGPSPSYGLARVGLGLCVPVNGFDTVVTKATASSPEVALGILERQVFSRADEELRKARLLARTATYAVLATPSELKVGDAHEHVYLFYVLLVDTATGRLTTLLWATPADPGRRTPPSSLTVLPPRLVYRCGLDVEAERLLGTIPINWSFAMRALPPGRRFATTERLRPWMTDPHRIASEPDTFERLVRDEVKVDPETPPRVSSRR